MPHQANQAVQIKPKIINLANQAKNQNLPSTGRLKAIPISNPLKQERKKILYHYVTGLSPAEVELLKTYLKLSQAGILDNQPETEARSTS